MVIAALVLSAASLFGMVVLGLALSEVLRSGTIEASPDEEFAKEISLPPGVFGARPSGLGLPTTLDNCGAHLILFVSPLCRTCNKIAAKLKAEPRLDGVTLVATAGAVENLTTWLEDLHLPYDTMIDADAALARSLGVEGSPAVIGLANGEVAFGAYLGGHAAFLRVVADRNRFAAGRTAHIAPGIAASGSEREG